MRLCIYSTVKEESVETRRSSCIDSMPEQTPAEGEPMTADLYWQLADRIERFVLVGLLGLLAYRLVPHLADKPVNLVYLASETMVIVMVVFRRTANVISRRSADWVISFAGTLLTLLVVRSDGAALPYGGVLLLLGFGIAVSAKLALWRSFGVVAANRGVRTGGLYSLVRHPMYLGYFVTHLGFLLTNPVPWNVTLYTLWTACQLHRIRAEERVLSADTAYVAFARRVRYRLVPFVY
jgi:protein-S-isoprenylcysteine O-methyltransferase Ste14